MRILERTVYVGPSLYAHFPVIRLELDLQALEAWPTARLGPAFVDGLLAALPGLAEHGCSYRAPGGFVRRLREDEGTWLGHVLEHVAIELQNVAGENVTFGKTRSVGDERPGVYSVVYEYAQREEGIAAGELGLKLLCSLLPTELRPAGSVPEDWDWESARDDFIRYAQRRALGPSTASLVRAAEERGIPWLRLNTQSLIQFGHGKYQQRIQATITGRTPHIAVELASDKEETNKILASLGLPVPRQELVTDAGGAVRAARKLGGAVVTKPYNGNHGRGITINISGEDEIRAGFEAAREHSRSVIVETYVGGDDHRLLVVNGELIAATRRTPGHVVGDGKRTIAELVEAVNQDPRRGVGHEKVLTRLELDAQATLMMERAGYTAESVPADDEVVYLRSTANLSTGGTATDVTDIIHPDNRDMAAVRAIGLDVGGVDFISPNIAESYKNAGGGICEINAAPGFRMHVAPSEGTPRDAAGPVIDMLFPPGAPSRVPIAAVTGTNGKTTTARMLAHIAKMGGYTPGLTTTDGVYIDGQRTVEGDMTGPVSARMVLSDPQIDLAVLETARGGLLRAGMGVSEVNVGAVINIQSDHLGLKGIDTLEQLAEVKRVVVEVAKDCAVLNADDPNVLKMSAYTDAKVICYVTMNPAHALVREHIRAGGRACALEAGVNGHMITLYDKGSHIPLLWTHLIPATMEGRALHNVQNAMVAAAMAFSMGIKLDAIRHGLRTFDTTFFQAPGRMNVYNEHPFKVLMDYGHNAHAVGVMADLAQRLDVAGRRLVVVAGPGDRRDEDLHAIAEAVAGKFDHYVCRRDDGLRGRDGDEVPRIIAKALQARGVSAEAITIIPDEQAAIDASLRMARSGDLLLVFADALARSWKQIIHFQPEGAVAAATARIELPPLEQTLDEAVVAAMEGVVRDERGLRFEREESD
jgi:cyanophycin synthetase